MYVIRRIVVAAGLMLAVASVVFVTMRLLAPGDPAQVLAGELATPEQFERVRSELGLDRSLPEQYFVYLGSLLRGDLGRSLATHQPVLLRLLAAFPITLALTLATLGYTLIIGLAIGVLAARWPDGWLDHGLRVLAALGASLPTYWLGVMLLLVFAVRLGWLPAQGGVSPTGLILPAITLGTWPAALLGRMLRAQMLVQLSNPYYRTALAKGAGPKRAILRHALRNALIPLITLLALQTGNLLGGAVVTETIFGLPGVGTLTISAVRNLDYPLVQGAVLFLSGAYLLLNFLADLLYGYLNPRIHLG